MRITSGIYRGRNLWAPPDLSTRPTQDRVREAVFSMIQFELQGKSFLDLFAGTGAVGMEAVSRGAASATLVECAPKAIAAIEKNLALIGRPPAINAIRRDVFQFLTASAQSNAQYDFIFADPPYELLEKHSPVEWAASLPLAPDGMFILEARASTRMDTAIPGLELLRDRTYGQSRILLFRKTAV